MKINVCSRCGRPIDDTWHAELKINGIDEHGDFTDTGLENVYDDANNISLCKSCNDDFISFMKEPTYECN